MRTTNAGSKNAHSGQKPVLILGAGVNGAALARELLLEGIPVCMVDQFDAAFGATSKSSRLIHGGLRYLEYGDLKLVRESLAERSRLIELVPHLVQPLRLSIPVRKRFGGLLRAAARFFRFSRRKWLRFLANRPATRGLWTVRFGLWLYDRFSRDSHFPRHSVQRVTDAVVPQVDSAQFRWLCSYTDAQMPFPERFVIELLEDARRIGEENQTAFSLHTYSTASIGDGCVTVSATGDSDADSAASHSPSLVNREKASLTFEPAAIVNATGAWGDWTLKQLGINSPRLFGGTKGSHFITCDKRLCEALGEVGVYAEARDGRLVFVLPFRDCVLVGTTDERIDTPPEQVVATKAELDYLLQLVNEVFPQIALTRADVELHYSGVRPLPFVAADKPSSVSRDHDVHVHPEAPLPTFTLIGGKLTTARAFAEEAADAVLSALGRHREYGTRQRPLPGGSNVPDTPQGQQQQQRRLAERFHLSGAAVQAVWELFGGRSEEVLEQCGDLSAGTVSGTNLPRAVVRWIIEHEWVTRLCDLVERRLLLVYQPRLKRDTLDDLAGELVACGRFPPAEVEAEVSACIERLQTKYGKSLNAGSAQRA